jgi:hypothetical protein
MNLQAFTDELLSLPRRQGLAKTAKKGADLFLPFAAIGGATGLGTHGYKHLKAQVTGNPWDKPFQSAPKSAVEGVIGGLTAAGVLKLLGRLAKKGKG